MTFKSVFEIDVQDEKFKAFMELFSKYQSALKQMPAMWSQAQKQMAGFTASTKSSMQNWLQTSVAIKNASANMQRLSNASRENARFWKDTAKYVSGTAKDITKIVTGVLKLAGVGGIFAGLLGAGSLFGLKGLAQSAASQGRSASGLNITTGQQRAFGLNFRQFVNPDSFLSSVTEAMQDLSKRSSLYGAGLTEADLQGKNPAQVAAMLIPKLRERFIQSGKTQQGIEAFQLGQFGSLEDFNRLANASPKQLQQAQRQYDIDSRNLNLTEAQISLWTRLNQQLDRAGIQIENSLIQALSPLAPQISKLSDAFSNFISKTLGGPEAKKWIDNFANGLGGFADWIKKGKLQEYVESGLTKAGEFGNAIIDLTAQIKELSGYMSSLGAMVKWIADIGEKMPWFKKAKEEWDKGHYAAAALSMSPAAAPIVSGVEGLASLAAAVKNSPSPIPEGMRPGGFKYTPNLNKAQMAQFSALEQKYKLPSNTLDMIYLIESSRGAGSMRSSAGALGPFQHKPVFSQTFGEQDPFNTTESAETTAKAMAAFLKRYKGDFRKAIAAYNAGQGAIDRASEYGQYWQNQLNPETVRYLQKAHIYIDNATGGSAVITTNQNAGY